MHPTYLPRSLKVDDKTLSEEQLLQEGRVIIVLAEPGAGKTELLKTLAGLLQTTRIRASIFRHKGPPVAGAPLVIDAMDEVTRLDSAATDAIIAQASAASASATVVFAGRSSEWDERTTRYVEECFGVEAVVVRLDPFDEAEQRDLFGGWFPGEDFAAFQAAVWRFELGPLLGNPQFLRLFGEAYLESGRAFTSKPQIFRDAVARLAHESNPDLGRRPNRPPADQIARHAGEVFAKLLLAGATGVATVEQLSDRDFPYLPALSGGNPASRFLLDTRLTKPSDDADKHEPIHRIVAEYCAARYVVGWIQDATDLLSSARIFAVLAPNGVTRDELRGMLGWMAALGGEPLQLAAVRLDPYAVLANGDPSQLSAVAKLALLRGLEDLTERDPLFRRADVRRRFNVGQFVTPDILDEVQAILRKPGPLQELILELVAGTGAARLLLPDLVALVQTRGLEGVRRLALDEALAVPDYGPVPAFDALLQEGSAEALELASLIVRKRGVACVRQSRTILLLRALAALYQAPLKRSRGAASRYFITRLVASFGRADTIAFLDALSPGIACSCAARYAFQCTCRKGPSKIAGRLLDRYFDLHDGPHHVERVWSWLKNLHFGSGIAEDRSASVKALAQDAALRRAIQRLSVQDARGPDAVREEVTDLYQNYTHAGLRLHAEDREALSQFAFDHGLLELWTELLVGHDVHTGRKGPNPARAREREQSRTGTAFLAGWSRRDRAQRRQIREARAAEHMRHRRRYAARERAVEVENRAHLRDNIAQIEAGQHWGWLQHFAHTYLHEPEKLATVGLDDETPRKALRSCFAFVRPHVPTLPELSRRHGSGIAQVLFAACLVRFRDGESLSAVDLPMLEAVKTECHARAGLTSEEAQQFEGEVDAALFPDYAAAEAYLRNYVEPQLAAAGGSSAAAWWLENKAAFRHLRPTLALEWLEAFPEMPLSDVRALFSVATRFSDRERLRLLIGRRAVDAVPGGDVGQDAAKLARERRAFWLLNAFLYHAPGEEVAWAELRQDPRTLLALEHVLGRFQSEDGVYRPALCADDVYRIMDAFIDAWPKVPLPQSYGSGDPESETAYRFLTDLVWKVTQDTPQNRLPVLDRIIADPRFADFREVAKSLYAEAARKRALESFEAPPTVAISALLASRGPASVEDLRALMVEALAEVQRWLRGSETNPLAAFYDGGTRVNENTARDRIVDQLQGQMRARGIAIDIERHMAGGNRCDITASVVLDGRRHLLVIEVKGQWHPALFTAADAQLDQRYAIHPAAAGQGIYLVLWYGPEERIAGRADPAIATPGALREAILAAMSLELRGRVDVVVLDLSRGGRAPKRVPPSI